MLPYCLAHQIGVTPWSPLARGILAGTYKGGFEAGTTTRSQGQDVKRTESLYRGKQDFAIAERVTEIAEKYGKQPAQIAVAWLLSKPAVTSPVIGVSKVEQLEALVAATDIALEEDDVAYLEALYEPMDNLLSSGSS